MLLAGIDSVARLGPTVSTLRTSTAVQYSMRAPPAGGPSSLARLHYVCGLRVQQLRVGGTLGVNGLLRSDQGGQPPATVNGAG